MVSLPQAAYVPFHPEIGFDRAVELAKAYLHEVGGNNAIVVVPLKTTFEYSEPLKNYARDRTVLTPRNSNQNMIGIGHPVLAYAPALKELVLASRYAGEKPIAVVEDPSFPCTRWADEIGAINLVEQKVHTVQRAPEHQKILEAIDWAGNNGWGDAPGRRDLRRHLEELADLGALDKYEVLAYQIVRGRHGFGESLQRLSEEIDKLQV